MSLCGYNLLIYRFICQGPNSRHLGKRSNGSCWHTNHTTYPEQRTLVRNDDRSGSSLFGHHLCSYLHPGHEFCYGFCGKSFVYVLVPTNRKCATDDFRHLHIFQQSKDQPASSKPKSWHTDAQRLHWFFSDILQPSYHIALHSSNGTL